MQVKGPTVVEDSTHSEAGGSNAEDLHKAGFLEIPATDEEKLSFGLCNADFLSLKAPALASLSREWREGVPSAD